MLNTCVPRICLDPYKTVEFCKQDCSLKHNNQTCDVEKGSWEWIQLLRKNKWYQTVDIVPPYFSFIGNEWDWAGSGGRSRSSFFNGSHFQGKHFNGHFQETFRKLKKWPLSGDIKRIEEKMTTFRVKKLWQLSGEVSKRHAYCITWWRQISFEFGDWEFNLGSWIFLNVIRIFFFACCYKSMHGMWVKIPLKRR